MLPLLALLLAVTGLFANAPVVAVAVIWSATIGVKVPPLGAAVLAAAAVGLDVAHRAGRGPRPIAVHTQVPQGWGHRHGAWWAAARYGLRLGFGPATILNTWTWWAGMLIALSWGPLLTFGAISAFVGVRTLTTIMATLGPSDGLEMARRSQHLDRMQDRARRFGQVLVMFAAVVTALGSWSS